MFKSRERHLEPTGGSARQSEKKGKSSEKSLYLVRHMPYSRAWTTSTRRPPWQGRSLTGAEPREQPLRGREGGFRRKNRRRVAIRKAQRGSLDDELLSLAWKA